MLEAVRDRARAYFEDATPAHDWHHVQRVEALATTLAERHPEPVDERVLRLAVLLHDVGRSREDRGEIDDHAKWGAAEAGRLLATLGADEETIERVRHCVRAHRYSNNVEPETVEAKVLADADNLDALGAVGLARVFAHGSALGRPMDDPAIPIDEDDTTAGQTQLNHVRKKILHLPDRMYTAEGERLATDRAAFVADFVERFEREVRAEA